MSETKQPVTYCGVDICQDEQAEQLSVKQTDYMVDTDEPSPNSNNLGGEIRKAVGSLIWPAREARS